MRTHWKLALVGAWAAMLFSFSLTAQEADPADSTGLPGDHFSLEGAIEMFKKAKSPEDFERLLNIEDNAVNNLDLNDDGEIDYIRVIDNLDGDAHAIVLQVPVSADESQDIAVIEIEKDGAENAVLQIIGNEDVFGEEVIAEPFDTENKIKGNGPSAFMEMERIVVNVWLWPSVRFVYAPGYVVWASPWRWRHYPAYWRPWRPHPWHRFHVRALPYRAHYHVVTTHRVVRAHKIYGPRRTSAKVVHTRTTTVVAARGEHGRAVGKKTTTSTTVNGRNGRVTKEKTTTKVERGARNDRGDGQKQKGKVNRRRG